jgi:hypothetical protein
LEIFLHFKSGDRIWSPPQILSSSTVLLGVQLRVSHLLGWCSTTWAMPLALFVLVIFEIWSCFMLWHVWTTILLFVHPSIAGMTDKHHCSQPLVEMGSCILFTGDGLEPQSLPPKKLGLQAWAIMLSLPNIFLRKLAKLSYFPIFRCRWYHYHKFWAVDKRNLETRRWWMVENVIVSWYILYWDLDFFLYNLLYIYIYFF